MPQNVKLLLACDPNLVQLPNNGAVGDLQFNIVGQESAADRIARHMKMGNADIVLLDVDRDNFDAFNLTQQITTASTESTVILVSKRTEPEALRSAMLAGAEEYLIKPLQPDALMEALVSVWDIRMQKRKAGTPPTEEAKPEEKAPGQLIAILGGKGGVGKTTVSVNLALTILRETGKNVALVGMESADATVLLGLQARAALTELQGNPEFDRDFLMQYGVSHTSGLTYYTAHTGAPVEGQRFLAMKVAKRAMQMLQKEYDYIVIDFPQVVSDEELPITEMMDQVLVLCSTWDILVLRNTKQLLDALPQSVADRLRVVLNRSDRSDYIQMDDIKRALQREVAMMIQNDSKLAPGAVNTGNPFVLTSPQSPLSQDLASLARLVSGEEAQQATAGKKRFLFFS